MKMEARLRRDSTLMRAHALIDWESFVLILKKDLGICNLDVGLMEAFTDGTVEHQECMARDGNVCRFKLRSNDDQPINQTL